MDDARRAAEEATQQLQPVSNISCLEELFAPLDNKAEDGLESASTSFGNTSLCIFAISVTAGAVGFVGVDASLCKTHLF